jgi:hypothetical protein
LRPGLSYAAPSGLGFVGRFTSSFRECRNGYSVQCDVRHIFPAMAGTTID